MKIAVFDNVAFKFSQVLIDHWQSLGHIVVKDKGFDPKICVDADVLFFDWADQNIQRASNPADKIWEQIGGQQLLDKHVIVRAHDVECWIGQPSTIKWEWAQDLIFVADHVRRFTDSYMHFAERYPHLKVHLIKHGVDAEKFTLRQDLTPNKKIATIGVWNDKKNLEMGLAILAELPRDYEWHVVAKELRHWRRAYVMDYIDRLKLNVTLYDHVPDVNIFLEDKSIFLATGMKEAFAQVVGESSLKGLKPIVRRFYGYENVWPQEWGWDTVSEAKELILGDYFPHVYRRCIEVNYPLQKMLEEYDKLLI